MESDFEKEKTKKLTWRDLRDRGVPGWRYSARCVAELAASDPTPTLLVPAIQRPVAVQPPLSEQRERGTHANQ